MKQKRHGRTDGEAEIEFCILFALYLYCLRAGGGAVDLYIYNRREVRRFITDLPKDCDLICDAVKNSLYNDGAGLLEDESISSRLGRIAYIDNFVRYFGAWLVFTDCKTFLSDLSSDDLYVAGDLVDMRKLERIPSLDTKLLKDILEAGDDETSLHNLTLYLFSLWVNYHVGKVVAMFQKWVTVYGDNVPTVLRDTTELARCFCGYTRTNDNSVGGIFYDGSWFETFAICGQKRRDKTITKPQQRATPAQPQQGTSPAQPQQSATVGAGTAPRIGDAADRLLNKNAARYVSEYKYRESFEFRCDDCAGVKVNLQKDIGNNDTTAVERLLCGEVDDDGWCAIPKWWQRPCKSRCKSHVGNIFFSHVEPKKDAGGGDANYWRIASEAVKIHGGAHGGKVGRKHKPKPKQ